eukprot:6201336-Pleurochrysis_carterae.AAC.1
MRVLRAGVPLSLRRVFGDGAHRRARLHRRLRGRRAEDRRRDDKRRQGARPQRTHVHAHAACTRTRLHARSLACGAPVRCAIGVEAGMPPCTSIGRVRREAAVCIEALLYATSRRYRKVLPRQKATSLLLVLGHGLIEYPTPHCRSA